MVLASFRLAATRFCLTLALLLLLTACDTLGYYGQAARGQISLLLAREEINAVLARGDLPQAMQYKLELVLAARNFAETELDLPAGESYQSYVDLQRSFVIWNVFAAPEFSSVPINWCYPIAGCVSYRGYFSESSAQRYASVLQDQGKDVYSGGVDAYSTLGWFADPITSSVLRRADHSLVALVFHELAHQRLYLPGNTTFNESFASFVEQEGLRRWLVANPQPGLAQQINSEIQIRTEFIALVTRYRALLTQLYATDMTSSSMRERKGEIQQALRTEYEQLRSSWGYSGYDRWFEGPLNNAQLATVASYNELVPAFSALLELVGGDMTRFYASVEELTRLSDAERSASLLALL
jgi:predicted aminopeptidase